MGFDFNKAMLKVCKELKNYIDSYLAKMDFEFMSQISKKDINAISKAELNKLGIKPSSYHKITYIPEDKLNELGFDENPNNELNLNKDAVFFEFEKLPLINSPFILEFYNNTCKLIKDDIERIELSTGKDLINEIYEYLNIETYKEELHQIISDYQRKVL